MKNRKTNFTIGLLVAGLCCGEMLYAQQLHTAIDPAPESKFYRIEIPQAFRALIGNDLGKLRIKNKQSKQKVPFIIASEETSDPTFKAVASATVNVLKDSLTQVVIVNPSRKAKTAYTLRIANAALQKTFRIEGSNDSSTWFALSNNGQLQLQQQQQQTYVEETLDFPLNDYAYLRILFNDKKAAPLNIQAVGEIITAGTSPEWRRIAGSSFSQKADKAKKQSLISLKLAAQMPVDYIQFHIHRPNQYQREGELYILRESIIKGRKVSSRDTKSTFTLQSGKQNSFPVHDFFASKASIRIDNLDNEALKIDSISLYQAPRYILAELEKGISYELEADSSWSMPQYDLANMNINSAAAGTLGLAAVAIESPRKAPKAKSTFGNYILWLGIGLGIVLVFYFSRGLLKDMNTKEEEPEQKP